MKIEDIAVNCTVDVSELKSVLDSIESLLYSDPEKALEIYNAMFDSEDNLRPGMIEFAGKGSLSRDILSFCVKPTELLLSLV